MELLKVKNIHDIKDHDTLIVTGGGLKNETFKNVTVKVSMDGTEVILRKKGNKYFNLGMYLNRKSWVKKVKILR